MQRYPKAPRLTLATNPSIPRRQGVTLEPLDPDPLDFVRVVLDDHPDRVTLRGYTHRDAAGNYSGRVVVVEMPREFFGEGIDWLAELLPRIGCTVETPDAVMLHVVRGGLPS